MSLDTVREYFKGTGLENRIQELDASSATVELAAQALGCDSCRIAKTLSFLVHDEPVLVVASGDARIHNHKFKEQFGIKAKMIPAGEVLERIGHDIGGVCPFGIRDGVKVYLDDSLKRFETVFPACGSSNSAIELTLSELERFGNSESWVDVCRIPETE